MSGRRGDAFYFGILAVVVGVALWAGSRDDDEPMIDWAKKLAERGDEVYILTRDNFDKHVRNERITQGWFERHVISYQWVAGVQLLLEAGADVNAQQVPIDDEYRSGQWGKTAEDGRKVPMSAAVCPSRPRGFSPVTSGLIHALPSRSSR